MYHISDVKKFNRCPHLFRLAMDAPREPFQSFIRLDEAVTDLAARKLQVGEHFLGQRNDPKEKALAALPGSEWLVKARFEYRQLRVKVPFLHRTAQGWDLYFLFVGLYPHADDMQFYCDTVWVLEKNGLALDHIRIVHLNGDYVRGKELDPEQLFIVSDCFYNAKNHPSVSIKEAIQKNKHDVSAVLDEMDACTAESLGRPVRTPRCSTRSKCRFYDVCFPQEKALPADSIVTLNASQYRYQMQQEGRSLLKDADIGRIEGTRQQYAQICADQNGGLFADKTALRAWMKGIRYPLIFLDFEWECYAIPPYEGMRPYDVLPFEYSIHIMQEDGSLTHREFLSIHDDRRQMAEGLIRDIPAAGTVIAYNAEGAEKIRIQELAGHFPEYASQLLDINARMKDLQVPFATGMVYDVRMNGLWSLKKIMAMMDDPGYKDLDIAQGMQAVFQWRHLDRSEEDADSEKILQELKAYCGMDSYAMSVVYQWLLKIVRGE